MTGSAVASFPIKKMHAGKISLQEDFLACEEPLEIRLVHGTVESRITKNIAVTMRTPGNDYELACGFLFTEGIIRSGIELKNESESIGNIIEVELCDFARPDLQKTDRNFYTTSSCGVCGKSSIDSIRTVSARGIETDDLLIPAGTLYALPHLLRSVQDVFDQTGGLHAASLFDTEGNILLVREDVGRHNALDKLIGSLLVVGCLPLDKHILLLSGRASFELIQKAAMAGIKVVAAVGAPSTLAVELAQEFDMTLIGFLRDERFNVYCGEKRIAAERADENS